MNRFKLAAFKAEFPFLEGTLPEGVKLEDLDAIHVKRMDKGFLNSLPKTDSCIGALGESREKEWVSFSLVDHRVLYDQVAAEGEHRSNYAHEGSTFSKGETVLEAIDRLSLCEEISAIVVYRRDYADWPGQDRLDQRELVIYKLPRNTTIREFVEEARACARAQVVAESSF